MPPLIFVYFNFRGKLQPIRHMACCLQLNFVEVHLEDKEETRKCLPQEVIRGLKSIPIEKHLLPLLVHNGLCIYDTYPIMAYISRKFNREDLMGRNIKQKVNLPSLRPNSRKS